LNLALLFLVVVVARQLLVIAEKNFTISAWIFLWQSGFSWLVARAFLLLRHVLTIFVELIVQLAVCFSLVVDGAVCF
jgi:hypothetical protein